MRSGANTPCMRQLPARRDDGAWWPCDSAAPPRRKVSGTGDARPGQKLSSNLPSTARRPPERIGEWRRRTRESEAASSSSSTTAMPVADVAGAGPVTYVCELRELAIDVTRRERATSAVPWNFKRRRQFAASASVGSSLLITLKLDSDRTTTRTATPFNQVSLYRLILNKCEKP